MLFSKKLVSVCGFITIRVLSLGLIRELVWFVNLKGVAGGTASGKTTVCNMIVSQLRDQRVVLVSQVLSWLSSGCNYY